MKIILIYRKISTTSRMKMKIRVTAIAPMMTIKKLKILSCIIIFLKKFLFKIIFKPKVV